MGTSLTFILLLVILILVIQLRSDLTKQVKDLQQKLDLLLLRGHAPLPDPKPEPEPVIIPEPEPIIIIPEPVVIIPEPVVVIPEPVIAISTPVEPYIPAEPDEPRPTFWEKNPDLEKFIGENLFNKIGIAILVIGMGFFLKFAIDKDWINEIGRTFIGIISGGILIGVAHRMRKTFAAFSSVLVGGGVAILYFSITIAFQQYHLIGQTVAFLMMILITGFTVLLSLSYNRIELAILAILGGFCSPFLVSTGAGNATVLFTYILILNVGMLVLAYYKKWHLVNIVSYAATVLLFGTWLTASISAETPAKPVPYGTALLFASLFYIVFFLMNVINNIKNQVKFKAPEIIILLSNTFFYFSAGMVILQHIQHGIFQGLFTACIAIFNFIFAYALYRNERADRNLIYLLIGLVLSFLSLAAPIQLEGNYITLFWAVESVLLFWLYQKSGIQLMKFASIIVLGLMGISLLIDWTQLYGDKIHHLIPVANRGFITGAVSIGAMLLLRKLFTKETTDLISGITAKICRQVLALATVIVSYIVIILELHYQSNIFWPASTVIVTGAFNYLFLNIILCMSRKEIAVFRGLALVLSLIALISFPLYNGVVIDLRDDYLMAILPKGHFLFHYVLIGLVFSLLFQIYKTIRSLNIEVLLHAFQWACVVAMLYILSASLDHIAVISAYKPHRDIYNIVSNNQKTGYAILWGVFAFVLIYLGLRWQSRQIRIISISVFAITLLKLFIFDLRGLSEGGKIAAFISLGILLLIISFMYQRLKKIILTDDK